MKQVMQCDGIMMPESIGAEVNFIISIHMVRFRVSRKPWFSSRKTVQYSHMGKLYNITVA